MMLTFQQALQKAAQIHTWAVGMCDNFVANMYGYSSSGYTTALSHWNSLPGADQHPGDMNAPAGALMFWGGGDGHVAISDGQGGIYSTDILGSGTVGHVSAGTITTKWGKQYLGWSPPIFQGGGAGSVGAYSGNSAQNATLTSSAGSALLGFLTGSTGFNTDVKDMLQRGALIIFGGILIVMGVISITKSGGVKGSVNSAVKAHSSALKVADREVVKDAG